MWDEDQQLGLLLYQLSVEFDCSVNMFLQVRLTQQTSLTPFVLL